MSIRVVNADCLEALKGLDDCSVDAVITDPPYGLSNTKPQQVADVLKAWVTGDTVSVPAKRGGFMGADWDSFVPPPAVWEECMRVLKPGGHMAVFAGARTQDLMGLSIRLAGFEIRDTLGWIYGSGFPKSMDISKAIDKAAGAKREVVGSKLGQPGYHLNGKGEAGPAFDERLQKVTSEQRLAASQITAPATSEAAQWSGWGTSIKPAIEPIILARKPLDGTVAGNVLAHGVGGLNIDACRVQTDEAIACHRGTNGAAGNTYGNRDEYIPGSANAENTHTKGRFPANVLLDEHAAAEMDEQSGVSTSPKTVTRGGKRSGASGLSSLRRQDNVAAPGDSGGASRFFPVFKYQAKAPKKERPVIVRDDGSKIQHPTVKPLTLIEWLVTLITPPGGTVLDPFAGTGTTMQAAAQKGFNSIGIEQSAEYVELINQRLADAGLKGAA